MLSDKDSIHFDSLQIYVDNSFSVHLVVADDEAMNFPDISSVMSTASGSGNGGSNNNHNHNVYSNNGLKHDPFSFLEEDGGDGDITMGLMVKPLRDPLISLDDLVRPIRIENFYL